MKDMMNMQQIEAWPVSQIQTPSPALFLSEEELRRELGTPMVDIGQDLAARARFDPKAAERAKPALGQEPTIRLLRAIEANHADQLFPSAP
jgi:hypothetical protein